MSSHGCGVSCRAHAAVRDHGERRRGSRNVLPAHRAERSIGRVRAAMTSQHSPRGIPQRTRRLCLLLRDSGARRCRTRRNRGTNSCAQHDRTKNEREPDCQPAPALLAHPVIETLGGWKALARPEISTTYARPALLGARGTTRAASGAAARATSAPTPAGALPAAAACSSAAPRAATPGTLSGSPSAPATSSCSR
jgi:hypothetical protein